MPAAPTPIAKVWDRFRRADNHGVENHRQLVRLGNIIDEPPYARGPNTWGHSFGIEHPDGSMQLIPIVGGKWRA